MYFWVSMQRNLLQINTNKNRVIFLKNFYCWQITLADRIYFQKPDYTFPKVFDALNPNMNAELLYHVRISRYPNLNVQKRPFSSIFEVMYAKQVNFAQKSTSFSLSNSVWFAQISFFFAEISQFEVYEFPNFPMSGKLPGSHVHCS